MLAAVCAGCGLPDVTDPGVHVEVAADPGLRLCGGTVAHMDAFMAAVAGEFGFAAPTGDDRVTYYWLDTEDYYARSDCPVPSQGCARGTTAYSYVAPLNHELVHTLADRYGRAPPFFGEGLATAYQGLGLADAWDAGPGAVGRTLEARASSEVDYRVAGAFVRHLVERHGVRDVLRVIDDLPRRVDAARVDRSFREILGASLADSVAGFEAARAACPDRSWTALLLECAAPEVAWDGVWLAEHRTLACDQEDVVGPYFGDMAIVFETVEVDEGGWFDVAAIAEGGAARVLLTPCGGCARGTATVADGAPSRVRLERGRYSVRLVGPALRDIGLGWSMARVE